MSTALAAEIRNLVRYIHALPASAERVYAEGLVQRIELTRQLLTEDDTPSDELVKRLQILWPAD